MDGAKKSGKGGRAFHRGPYGAVTEPKGHSQRKAVEIRPAPTPPRPSPSPAPPFPKAPPQLVPQVPPPLFPKVPPLILEELKGKRAGRGGAGRGGAMSTECVRGSRESGRVRKCSLCRMQFLVTLVLLSLSAPGKTYPHPKKILL